jgi:hypothetical protein
MRISTASETISLANDLENQTASTYRTLASGFGNECPCFESFAAENVKTVAQVGRAYFGMITDAIEGCFAFDLDPDDYPVEVSASNIDTLGDALKMAIRLEETIGAFYRDASEQGKATMADIARTFATVARKRDERVKRLRLLLGSEHLGV